jgi:hydrogenase/urease accessory protein HupE
MPILIALATLGAPAAAAPVPHELAQVHLDVSFLPDGTYQIDLYSPPDWLLATLEPLAGPFSGELLEGEARERRLAELAPVLAEWVWILFDGVRVAARPEYIGPLEASADGSGEPMVGIRMRGVIPDGAREFSWACGVIWDPYPILVADAKGTTLTHWVEGPVESGRLSIAELTPPSRREVVGTYLGLGFTHILPRGLDHILFVIGLFLLSARLRPIVAQVTTFTVAHTITLALTIFGIISLPPAIVEPLIALSIAYVAVENLFTSELKPWRVALVFGFGLLHGMGFAGVLSELGLPRSERITGLLSFNVGVELGQLAVIAGMLLLVGWFRRRPWYRRWVVVPLSVAIAAVGLFWTVGRIVGA